MTLSGVPSLSASVLHAAVLAGWVLVAAFPARAADRTDAASANAGDSRRRAVDALFEQFDRPGSPGAAIGIYQGGDKVYARGYGRADLEHDIPVTPQTVFHVASVSKQFAAFAIALLAREGKVDLDADIRTYLPYVPDFGHVITARQLIHHTSGLRDQWALFELGGQGSDNRLRQQQVLNMVARQQALNFEPGSEHLYSNTGYTLLAEIVRAVSGRTLRQFTTERMFQPLGMSHTFFYDDVTEIVPARAHSYEKGKDGAGWRRALLNYDNVGATSLFTTAEDLLRWAGNFARPVVGDAALIEQIGALGALRDGTRINYGFALWRSTLAGHEALAHTGSDAGYRAVFAYFPAEDFAIALLANHPPAQSEFKLTEAIAELYLNAPSERPTSRSPAVIAPDHALLQSLAGHYLHPFERMISLTQEGGGLVWQSAESEPASVVFRADGTFDLGEAERVWSRYRPRRDEQGRVAAIEEVTAAEYGKTQLYHRIEPVSPTPATLAELTGDYRSPELDITYTFTVEEGRLTARSLWSAQPIVLVPVVADRFDVASWADAASWVPVSTIVVQRHAQGQVSGLKVYGWGMRHVQFEKAPPP